MLNELSSNLILNSQKEKKESKWQTINIDNITRFNIILFDAFYFFFFCFVSPDKQNCIPLNENEKKDEKLDTSMNLIINLKSDNENDSIKIEISMGNLLTVNIY